jgi:hypothetical protein
LLYLNTVVGTLQRTNTENWKQIFPEKELRDHSPNFHIYVSMSDLYIPHHRSAYSAAGNMHMWTDPRYQAGQNSSSGKGQGGTTRRLGSAVHLGGKMGDGV